MSTQHTTARPGVSRTPGRAARETAKPECRHFIGTENRYCRSGVDVRRFVPGDRCADHTPSALQGKSEPEPGPGWPIFREVQP